MAAFPAEFSAAHSDSPNVVIPFASLHVGQSPVPLQCGHMYWSELSATFWPLPKQMGHSPLPPHSEQRQPRANSVVPAIALILPNHNSIGFVGNRQEQPRVPGAAM
jgi:hypothetical protein